MLAIRGDLLFPFNGSLDEIRIYDRVLSAAEIVTLSTPDSGDTFPFTPPGPTITTVECTATDDSFNTDTASFNVTVEDGTAPLISAPPDVTKEATGVNTPVDIGMATATDNVGVTSITNDAPATAHANHERRAGPLAVG